METESAQPVLQPPSFATAFPAIDMGQVISVVFALIFIVWALYTLIASYHLLRYGHRSAVSIPAIITHVLVSGFLAIYAVSGIH